MWEIRNTIPDSSCSPNLAIHNQSTQYNSLSYDPFQDPLHIPVNLNAAQTPYMPQPPSMQFPTTNLQPHQVLGETVQESRRESHVGRHGDLDQYAQHLHGLQLINDQA